MSDFKCPFCGSDKLRYEAPYVELNKQGEYVPKTTFCCKQQATNQKFIDRRFKEEDKPELDEVSKW